MLARSKRDSLEGDIIEPIAKRSKVLDDGPCLRCKILKKKVNCYSGHTLILPLYPLMEQGGSDDIAV